MSNSSIWFIDRTPSDATTLGERRPERNSHEGVLYIPQSSRIGALPSDSLASYPGHLLRVESYSFAEIPPMHSPAPTHKTFYDYVSRYLSQPGHIITQLPDYSIRDLSIYLSIYLSRVLSIYLSIYPSLLIYQSIYRFILLYQITSFSENNSIWFL